MSLDEALNDSMRGICAYHMEIFMGWGSGGLMGHVRAPQEILDLIYPWLSAPPTSHAIRIQGR